MQFVITVIEGQQVLWSVLLSLSLQGLGMSEPELSPSQEKGVSRLQGVYFLGAVKRLLLYKVVAVTSHQIGALKQCQNFTPLPFHRLGGRSFINSFNKLLHAGYRSAADILIKHSPLLSNALLFCRRDKESM